MATERIRFVDAGSAGGDGTTRNLSGTDAAYATLNAALVAEYAANPNLVTADILLTIRCVGTTADGGAAVGIATAPFTTDATRYLIVETPIGDRTGNPWVWSTSRYRWSRSQAGYVWAMRNNKTVIRGLQVENTRNNTDAGVLRAGHNAAGGVTLWEENLIRNTGATDAASGMDISASTTSTVRIRNNVLIGSGSTTGTGISPVGTASGVVAYLDNNTIVGYVSGIAQASSCVVTARNNLVSATTCFSGTITQSYNASTDATASGTGSRTSQTFTFENAAGGDYRITTGDAGARTYGTDLSADADNPFSTDYAQTARGATWDIGAHQVTVAASGGAEGAARYYYNRMMGV